MIATAEITFLVRSNPAIQPFNKRRQIQKLCKSHLANSQKSQTKEQVKFNQDISNGEIISRKTSLKTGFSIYFPSSSKSKKIVNIVQSKTGGKFVSNTKRKISYL